MSTKLKAGTATSGAVIDADTTGILELQSGSTPTTAITVDASQGVGIGTASPSGKLTVYYSTNGAYNTGVNIQNGNSGSGATTSFQLTNDAGNRAGAYLTSSTCSYYGGTNTFNLGTVESIPFTFLTGNSERMRITAAGQLLINSTSYAYVNSNNVVFGDGQGIFQHIAGTSSGASYCDFTYNAGRIGNISQNGTTAVAYNTTSDYRLKENVAPMQNALNVVQQLKPVTYTWKADGSEGQGFIAHELQEIVPDCVTGEKDAVDAEGKPVYQGIDTSFLVATLVAAIQELKAEVDALKGAK